MSWFAVLVIVDNKLDIHNEPSNWSRKNFTCSGGSVDGTRHSFEPRQNCTQSLHVDRIPHIMCYKKCYDYKRRSRMIAVVNHIEIKPMKSLSDLKARFLCDKINVLLLVLFAKSFFVQLALKITIYLGLIRLILMV